MHIKVKEYEDNLKDIMKLVMAGIPEDKAGKRELYDAIFKYPLPSGEARESPFDISNDATSQGADLQGDTEDSFRCDVNESPFYAADGTTSTKAAGKGAARAAPYAQA